MTRLANKTVLITGATKGIGLETSKRLHSCGYQLIGIARQPLKEYPGKLFLCDLSDSQQTAATILEMQKYPIDVIVNNVGVTTVQPLESIDLNSLYETYDLNVRTAVQIAQGFIHGMKQKKWGRIINIASVSIFGCIGRTAYAAAKSALIGCTRTWALELASFGVTVNAIAPGPVETEMLRKIRKVGSAEERASLDFIPMGRMGKPQEIAAVIEFLLSEDAGFITGQTICVDGGAHLPIKLEY